MNNSTTLNELGFKWKISMNILVTGAKGFIGRNLVSQLYNIQNGKAKNYAISGQKINIFEYDIDSDLDELNVYCENADFVFNLAGVNRPREQAEFMKGNWGGTFTLLNKLKEYGNKCPVMISSSIQAAWNNPYGESKRAGEQLMFDYATETGVKVLVYRFPNVFGKWCRPNYNSVVATFCNNIANDLPIQVNDSSAVISLVYVDDVVNELIASLSGAEHYEGRYCVVPEFYSVKLEEIVDLLYSFKKNRENLSVPDLSNVFEKKLYSTYLSYLPTDQFSYQLKINTDHRGSFTEIIRSNDRGQFSVNITKPHIVKGNHWHHTKNEKFVVVSGEGVIRFRNMCHPDSKVIEYHVSGDKIEVVDIPIGYTHNIENTGETDLITFIWCNECFDLNNPDTYFEEV